MRKNGRLFIILGVGLACLAVALAALMFANAGQSKAVETPPAPVRVVVAAKDVAPHQILRLEDLAEEQVDRDLVKGGEVLSKSEALGKAPKTGLVKGQRIIGTELEVPGLSNDIEKGKRAVAVPIDRLNAAGGLIREADYIDLIFSVKVDLQLILPTLPFEIDTQTAYEIKGRDGNAPSFILPATPPEDGSPYPYPGEPGSRFRMEGTKEKGDPLAKVVVQDVKVLRVISGSAVPAGQNGQGGNGQNQGANQGGASGAAPTDLIVLELSDEQAEVMKFVLDNGASFTFAVRAKDDHEKVNTSGITYDLLVTNYQLPVPKSVRLPGEKP